MTEIGHRHEEQSKPPAYFELTPENARELDMWVCERGFSLFGHGTPTADRQDFFLKGLLMNYDTISSHAIPLGATIGSDIVRVADRNFMDNWPHNPGSLDHINVVLLAIPQIKDGDGIVASQLDFNFVDHEEGDQGIPPELVVGFYDPKTGYVAMNPDLSLSPEKRRHYIEIVEQRVAAINNRPFPDDIRKTIETLPPNGLTNLTDIDDIW